MKVYIIHGYMASQTSHWFVWLKRELEMINIDVDILNLPTPNSPEPSEWKEALDKQIEKIDEDTYFVAHSLGCITLLKYLEDYKEKLGGYILVSGFNENIEMLPQLKSFLKPDIDYTNLAKITDNKIVISAKDDTIVSNELSKKLSSSLDAKYIELEKGGHFLESDGYKRFDLVLKELKDIISK